MVKLFIRIKHWYIERKLKNAIKKADWLCKKTDARFLVLRYKSGFLVKSKKQLKALIKDGYFVKGFDIQTAEKIAVYKTK
ncbi:hypothetical protein AGMMS4956_14230 [Bacteroidia bacterium]|nr:hypothetical protein AGMMS4956_14230 [Bacteroidia bacterium]